MARKTFFSFHYVRDSWRAGQVRNSNLLQADEKFGFIDDADWEKIEREGDASIERWIASQLKGTTCTVVLIGAETADRKWVDHEVRESWIRGNGIVGVRIHQILNQHGKADTKGKNPLDAVFLKNGKALSSVCLTYDWVADDGRKNLGAWIEKSVQDRESYAGETEIGDNTGKAAAVARSATIISSPAKPWCPK
jgi:hypothetical protein